MKSETVRPVDAFDDVAWFAARKDRRYRLRPHWAVRRVGTAFLRTPTNAIGIDDEATAEVTWWQSAWPDLSPKVRAKLSQEARKRRKGTSP